MKRITLLLTIFLSFQHCSAQNFTPEFSPSPVEAYKPWSFWYWMYGAVNKPAVKADLEGMNRVGLAGTYLMPIRSVTEKPEYEGKAEQLSPEFWDVVDYSMHIADSLRMKLGVHICDGFALAGGPWFSEEESMQRIISTDTLIEVPKLKKKNFNLKMQLPEYKNVGKFHKDIASYAIRELGEGVDAIPVDTICSENVTINNGSFRADSKCEITFDFGKPVTPLAIEITPSGTNFQCQRITLLHSDDGNTFSLCDSLIPARQGWQNYLYPSTYAIHASTHRYYKVTWTPEGTEPGTEDLDAAKWKANFRLKNIRFLQSPRINHWEGQAGYAWRIAKSTCAIDDKYCVKATDIVRLDIDSLGMMTSPVALAPGKWRIVRIGHASTGMTNATAGGAKGLECDKFSAKAVTKLIENWFAKFETISNKYPSRPLSRFHVDSWECGCQNWSATFASEFQKRRGYDILPWLPVMIGIPMESEGKSEKVLYDVRLTINELINENFFATVQQYAHAHGLEFSSEAIAPTMVSDGIDHYRYADLPMGEFWLNSPTHDKPNDMLDAISGAHIYGKNIVQAEGFTEVRGVWDEDPASVKPLLDRNFALGTNRLFFHVNAHNPWFDRKPGMTLDGIGFFFQRDQIWYEESKPFVDYITRCQALLQQGRPVHDIAVYTGDEMPRRAVLPERLVDMLPGIFGKARVEAERIRMANVGQPLEESPVGVRHNAGIVDTKDWVNALRGYQYDSMNPDALLRVVEVKDGRMIVPGGGEYRVLVVPYESVTNPNGVISKEAHAKIKALMQQGVPVITEKFLNDDLSKFGIPRDVVLPEGIAYTHRSSEDGEIYFLANQKSTTETFSASFRNTASGTPYLYNPILNTLCRLASTEHISLPAYGSCFVLFPTSRIESLVACLPDVPANIDVPDASPTTSIQISGPFTMEFRETGMKKSVSALEDWSQSDDIHEKFFSGHCMYTTTLKLKKKPSGNEVLNLGEVHNIAHVWVNDIDCGTTWTAPYSTAIGNALRKGVNIIRIEVVNTWANALRGMDEGTPPYPGIWTNAKYRMKTPHLLPAGLLGPLTIN